MRPVVKLFDAGVGVEGIMRALRDDRDRFRERAKEVCSGAGVGVNEATSSKEQEGGGGRGRRTVFIGVGKRDHVLGENLGDTADAGGDDVETGTGGFEDGDPKGFGEGCVEEDGAADEDLVSCWRCRWWRS